ncbi:MAG: hypothetical protein N2383_09170 [Caldilineales bacterium]|nr:hypothetical protein [Caldilineales bacterium]
MPNSPVAFGDGAVTIRPTLYLGCGGSGHRVLLHTRAAYGEQTPEWVRFLVLDSADEDLRLRHNGREWRLEPGNERLYLGDVSIPAIMRNLDRLTTLRETFGESLMRLPRVTYRDGVSGNRTAGRLTFHYHVHTVEQKLQSLLRDLSRQETAVAEELAQSAGLNIVLVASACGGQGSGALIDVAYLLRSLLAELGQLADNSRINAVFLLPDALPGVENRYLQPNTVECLRAVERWMAEGGFRTCFPNRREIVSPEAPFDRVFLVDGIDQKGRTRRSQAEVCAVVGQMLYLLFATAAGQKLQNDLANHTDLLGERTRHGEMTCFGTLGLAVMAADGRRVQRLCARRYAAAVIREGLLAEGRMEMADQAAQDFVAQIGLEADALRRALLAGPDGGLMAADFVLPGHVGRRPPEEVPLAATNHARDYRQVRLFRELAPRMDANAEALITAGLETMASLLQDVLRNNGLRQAAMTTATLALWLAGQIESWEQVARRCRQRQAEAEAALNQAEAALEAAGNQLFLFRRAAVAQALPRFERAAREDAEAFVERHLAEAALRVLTQIEYHARQRTQRYEAGAKRLEQALSLLTDGKHLWQRFPEEASTVAWEADIDLIDAAWLDQLYSDHAPQPQAGMPSVIAAAEAGDWPVLAWEALEPQRLAGLVAAVLQNTFAPLAELGVEDLVRHREDEVSAERWLTRLLEMAAPLCNLEMVRLVDSDVQPVHLAVLGVPDPRQTVFTQRPEMLAANGDPTRVVALTAILGLPLSALKQWSVWSRAYALRQATTAGRTAPSGSKEDTHEADATHPAG